MATQKLDSTYGRVGSPRAWNAAALLSSIEWQKQIPAPVLSEFVSIRSSLPSNPDDFVYDRTKLPALHRFAQLAKAEVFEGYGIFHGRGLSALNLTDTEQQIFFLAFGSAMGQPMTHYGRIYPIIDRGVDYTAEAKPVSMTNAETGMHTDSSSVDANPDILGLLCENPCENGGESQVVNGVNVYQQLDYEAPEVLALLCEDYIRDIVTPGKDANVENLRRNSFPIFTRPDAAGNVTFRYMRYWIERGQARAGEPLDQEHLAALDKLDELLSAKENMVSFQLRKGEILWLSNKTIAHNRTAFVDTSDSVRRLYRMWIGCDRASSEL